MRLTVQQKKANEAFFDLIIELLNDGGTYIYPEANSIFIKKNNQLTTEKLEYLNTVKEIVTKEYFNRTFSLTYNTK